MTARLRFPLAIVLVGLVAAGFAIAFRGSLAVVGRAMGGSDVVAMITNAPTWERLVLPIAGGLGAGVIALAAARLREGAGVGFVMEAIVLGRARIPVTRSILQSVASWLAIAGGNSLGREGPLIQIGAASGEAARRFLRLDDSTARVVLAAGVAAGFASAYNSPIAAVLFVVEIVTGVIMLEAVIPVIIAVAIATIVTRLAVGGSPLYGLRDFTSISTGEVLAFAGLGLVIAPVGVGFLRLLGITEHWWAKLPMPWRPALGGAVCGGLLVAMPMVAGNGFEPLGALLDGRLAIGVVAWLLLIKPISTAASVSSGNPGGVFTPTLLIGACGGMLYASGLHAVLGDVIGPPGAYALVGLAAALSATTHAPLTAAVLACELSGDYALVVPLLVAGALSAGLASRLYIHSVYTVELSRRGLRWRLTLDGRRIIASQQNAVDAV